MGSGIRSSFQPGQVAHIHLEIWTELDEAIRNQLIHYRDEFPRGPYSPEERTKIKAYLSSLSGKRLAVLPNKNFALFNSEDISQILTPDKIPSFSSDKMVQIFGDWTHLTPAQVQVFSPQVFRLASLAQLLQLNQACRLALSEAQLSHIQLWKAPDKLIINLSDQQIRWLGTRISEIRPAAFRNAIATRESARTRQVHADVWSGFQQEMEEPLHALFSQPPHPHSASRNEAIRSIGQIYQAIRSIWEARIAALGMPHQEGAVVNAHNQFTTAVENYHNRMGDLPDSPLKQQLEGIYNRLAHWGEMLITRGEEAGQAQQRARAGDALITRFILALSETQVTQFTGSQMASLTPAVWARIRNHLTIQAQQYAEIEGHARALRQASEEARKQGYPNQIEWEEQEMARYNELHPRMVREITQERFIRLAKDFIGRFGTIRFSALHPDIINQWNIPNWGNVFEVTAFSKILSVQSPQGYSKEDIRRIPHAVLEDLKEKGIPFLERLSEEQLGWLTRNDEGSERILPYSKEEIQAARVRQPDQLSVLSFRNMDPRQLDGVSRNAMKKLLDSPDVIASISDELLIAVVRKYIDDRELLNADFYIKCAQNAKFHVIPRELRQRIHPVFFENFTLDNFWEHVMLWSSPKLPRVPSLQQFGEIIHALTAEQLSKCLSLFKVRGAFLLPLVSPNQIHGIPAEAFRYLGELPKVENAGIQYINLTPEKIRNLILEQFSNMSASVFAELGATPLISQLQPAILEQLPYSHYLELNQYVRSRGGTFSRIWGPQQYGKLPEQLFADGVVDINKTTPECLPELTARQFLVGLKGVEQVKSLKSEVVLRIRPEVFALIWNEENSLLHYLSKDIIKNLPIAYYEALYNRVTQAGISFGEIWNDREKFSMLPPEIFARNFINLKELKSFNNLRIDQMVAWMDVHGNDLKWLKKDQLQTFNKELLNSSKILLNLNASQLRTFKIEQLRYISKETLREFVLPITSEDPRIKYLISKNLIREYSYNKIILTEENVRIAKMTPDEFSQLDLATIDKSSILFIHPSEWSRMTLENVDKLLRIHSEFGKLLTEKSLRNLSADLFAKIFSGMEFIQDASAVTSAQWNALIRMRNIEEGFGSVINIRPIDVSQLSEEVFRNVNAEFFFALSTEMWDVTTSQQQQSISIETKRELLFLLDANGKTERLEQLSHLGIVPRSASNYAKMTAEEFATKSEEDCRTIPGEFLPYLSEEVYKNLTLEQARGLISFPNAFQIPRNQFSAILQKYPVLIDLFYSQILVRLPQEDTNVFWKSRFKEDNLAPDLIRNLLSGQQTELIQRNLLNQEQVDIATRSAMDFAREDPENLKKISKQNIYFIVPEAWGNFSEMQWRALREQHPDLILLLSSPQFSQLSSARAAELLLSYPNLSNVPPGIFRNMTLDQWREWMRQPGFSLEGTTAPQLRAIPQNIVMEYGIQIQFKLNSNQYWLLKSSQRDATFISPGSIERASEAELDAWIKRLPPKNYGDRLDALTKEQVLVRGKLVTVSFLQKIEEERLAQMAEEQLRAIPRPILEKFVKNVPKNQDALNFTNRKVSFFVRKGIILETDVQLWRCPTPSTTPSTSSLESMADSRPPATAPKRKLETPEPSSPTKQSRQEKTVVLLVESESETAEQKTAKERARESYQQKPDRSEIPPAYKMQIRANGSVEYLHYDLQTGSYQTLQGPPQDLGQVDQFLLIGETVNHQIANTDAPQLGIHFKNFTRSTEVNVNPAVVLLACELSPTYVSQFLSEISTEEVTEGVSTTSPGRRVNPKYANLKVTSYLYPMSVSETGQRLVNAPDGHLYHGYPSAKFIFQRDDAQLGGVRVALQSTKGDGNIVERTPDHAGPFGEAERKQKLHELKQKWEEWNSKIQTLHEQIASRKTIPGNPEDFVVSVPHLKEEEGKFKIPVVNLKTRVSQEVEISQELGSSLLIEREKIKNLLEPLKPHIEETPDGNLSFKECELGWEKIGGRSLNLAFLAMALESILKNKWNLSSSQKLMIYWNFTGAVTAPAGDLTTWISTKMAPGGSIARSLEGLGRALEKANLVFLIGSDIFDFYQAITAKDPATQVGSGIRGGFTTLGLGAMFLGEGEIYAAPAIALGGLISTVAEYFIGETESEQKFFDWIVKSYESYSKGGIRINEQSGVVEITQAMKEINYRDNKITFSSDWIRKNIDENSSPDDANAWGNLREGLDIASQIPMEPSLSHAAITILPHTGEKYITYRRGHAPTFLDPKNTGIPAKLKGKGIIPAYDHVENDHRFTLAILPAHLEEVLEKPLPAKIILDQKNRNFAFPGPKIKGEDHYQIQGGGGQVIFTGLRSGVKLALEENSEGRASTFILHSELALLGGEEIRINNKKLTLLCKDGKNIEVNLTGLSASSQVQVIGTSESWKIDPKSGTCTLIGLDERGNGSLEELAQRAKRILDQLKSQGKTSDEIIVSLGNSMSATARTAEEIAEPSVAEIRRDTSEMLNQLSRNPYRNIPSDTSYNFPGNLERIQAAPAQAEAEKIAEKNARKKIDQETSITIYESKTQKLIGFDTNGSKLPKGAKLVGLTTTQTFFFHAVTQKLFSLERSSNQEKANQELKFSNAESRIEKFLPEGEQIRFNLVVPKVGKQLTFSLVLKENKLYLAKISGLATADLEAIKNLCKEIRREAASSKLFEALGLLPIGTPISKNLQIGWPDWLKLEDSQGEEIYVRPGDSNYYSISKDGKKVLLVSLLDPTQKLTINYQMQQEELNSPNASPNRPPSVVPPQGYQRVALVA